MPTLPTADPYGSVSFQPRCTLMPGVRSRMGNIRHNVLFGTVAGSGDYGGCMVSLTCRQDRRHVHAHNVEEVSMHIDASLPRPWHGPQHLFLSFCLISAAYTYLVHIPAFVYLFTSLIRRRCVRHILSYKRIFLCQVVLAVVFLHILGEALSSCSSLSLLLWCCHLC